MRDLFSLIVAPIIVGIATKLFSRWLDENDKDNDR
ncbi:type I toxin-antitoxin system Fst family toxin (plasmid) [Ligilactobacillus acidipiscis]|nr:type I toxin-antitoxin system Fst family toxin [Lactobacillus acetotolerans]